MKRKATIIILGIIILIMVLGSIGLCKSWERKNAEDTLQILIVGDSISEGAGASDPAFKWYKYLAPYVEEQYGKKLEITNVSMGGNTSYAGYVRIMQLNQSPSYDLVIVCFGENDAEETFATYYEQLLQTIVNKWCNCTIITILESSQRGYTPKIRDIQSLSLKYQTHIADTIAAFKNSGMTYEELCEDGTHPNDEGQKVYFNEIVRVLDEIYLKSDIHEIKRLSESAYGKEISDVTPFCYYSREEFEEISPLEWKIAITEDTNRIGIDYNRIPGEQAIEVFSDINEIWCYQYNWNYTFEQRHIEVINSEKQYLNELIICFSSEEQLENFNGIIVE